MIDVRCPVCNDTGEMVRIGGKTTECSFCYSKTQKPIGAFTLKEHEAQAQRGGREGE